MKENLFSQMKPELLIKAQNGAEFSTTAAYGCCYLCFRFALVLFCFVFFFCPFIVFRGFFDVALTSNGHFMGNFLSAD